MICRDTHDNQDFTVQHQDNKALYVKNVVISPANSPQVLRVNVINTNTAEGDVYIELIESEYSENKININSSNSSPTSPFYICNAKTNKQYKSKGCKQMYAGPHISGTQTSHVPELTLWLTLN